MDDLPLLVESLLPMLNEKHKCRVVDVAPGVMAALRRHAWPGNVRELRNVLARAVILAGEGTVDLSHLPPGFAGAAPRPPTAAADIVSVTSLSNDVMQLEINTPSPTEYYYPESKLDLTGGTWERIPHSDDGVNPFIIEDLNYSTTDGTNVFIYVETTNSAEFIRILGFD